MATRVEEIAAWAAAISRKDIPEGVATLLRDQRRSVFGAIAGSAGDKACERVIAALNGWAAPGPHAIPSRTATKTVGVEDAIYAAATASVALDFDDYVCFGHTGHSAVLVPLLIGAETGAGGEEQLVAQLIANEIEARLGGACLIGPQNGQLWSFIHAAGAALAAGRLFGLDRRSLAHALALTLYQPPRATPPGFFMPDSKVLTAAEPTVAGVRAARLAAAGVTGPLDALDHPQGFLHAFSHAPLVGMLGGLGEAWATSTLCVKPYPGCAYIDTAVDALLSLDRPPLDGIAAVEVRASMLTCAMDAMSRPYVSRALNAGDVPTPVAVTFSIPWSLAVVLVAGELGPAQVSTQWLSRHAVKLSRAADLVTLHHDAGMSQAAARAFSRVLPPRRVAAEAGAGGLLRAAMELGRSGGGLGSLRRMGDLGGLGGLGGLHLKGLHDRRRPLRGSAARKGAPARWWGPDGIARFAMTFPAAVTVRMKDGSVLEARADVPRGGAGHETEGPSAVAAGKLSSHGAALWGEAGTTRIERAIAHDDAALWELVAPAKGGPAKGGPAKPTGGRNQGPR